MATDPGTTAGTMKTSVQDSSAHLFVPYSTGTTAEVDDDSPLPGAYLRLGGYSGIESAVEAKPLAGGGSTSDQTDKFYPRQHITDEGSNRVQHAVGDLTTGSYKGGIMLACDGRMLMRAGERFYLHSVGAMHVDTESTLTVFAKDAISVTSDSTITIKSNNAQAILISADAGAGDVTTEAQKETRTVAGSSYEYIDEDKHTYTQADTYAYKLGHSESVTLGDTLSFFMGATYTVKVSVEITIALASLILIYIMKFEVGLLKMDFQKFKLEYKEGNFSWSNWSSKAETVDVKAKLTAVKTSAIEVKDKIVETAQELIASIKSAVKVQTGGPNVNSSAITVIT